MARPIYATTEQYEAYTESTAPQGIGPLLRRASGVVLYATRAAVYDTTSEGTPSDPDLAEAMTEATCALVQAWEAAGVDPVAGTGTKVVQSKSAAGASVTYALDEAEARRATSLASGDSLTGEAWRVLDAAGLFSTQVHAAGWAPGTRVLGA